MSSIPRQRRLGSLTLDGMHCVDMGGDEAPLTLQESVPAVAKVLTSLKSEDNGRLINYRHEIVPW